MLRRTGISTKHTGHGLTRTQQPRSFEFRQKMKFTWIYILSCAVVVTTSAPTSEAPPTTLGDVEDKAEEEVRQETLEDLVDLGNEETDLPILPPIILIDFTNGTNLTSEEKSKRTINGNLGYGFQGNNLFSGKYNYYFPSGKTGTTVSIEESISPFLPTTIIEKVNPGPVRLYANPTNSYPGSVHSNLFGSVPNSHVQTQIGSSGTPLAFGQRTKLQKTTGDDFQSFSRFGVRQKPTYSGHSTPKPDFESNRFSSGLGSYGNPSPVYQGYSTPSPPLYSSPLQGQYKPGSSLKAYNAPLQGYEGFSVSTVSPPAYNSLGSGASFGSYRPQVQPGLESYTTPKPQSYNPSHGQTTLLSPLGNTPKYSYEGGIKYEHKIVWKYPDGKVSEVGPNPDDGSYPGYSNPTKVSLNSNYQNNPASNNFPKTLNTGYSVNAGSIYSQKPATFPDNGPTDVEDPSPSPFVSSSSISNGGNQFPASASQATPPSQKYSFQSPMYQASKSQSSSSSSALYKPSFGKPTPEGSKVASSYPVNSPEAEYPPLDSYSTSGAFGEPDGPRASAYTYSQSSATSGSYGQPPSSSKVPSSVISKYTPQVQQYLKKALGLGESAQSQETYEPSNTGSSYSNLQYSNLLDYNPSISQYVRDPSTILNAQPTFVQAGNSLIPVIILRVDGVAPIQPQATPNINLKALLQKYLTQYAQTVNTLSPGNNYDQSYGPSKSQSSSGSQLFDLGQLTESLGQLGQGSNLKQNFAQNFAQQFTHDYQPTTRKPKVKNVEIINDPRFTSYKVKN